MRMTTIPARRPSTIPTIKCSTCSTLIDISRMGEHVCAQLPHVPPLSIKRFKDAYSSMSTSRAAPVPFRSRPGPPTIDASAANLPYNATRNASIAGLDSAQIQHSLPPRSFTTPLPQRAPSPEIPLAQECAFPVFPTARVTGPKPRLNRSQTDHPSLHITTSPQQSRGGSPFQPTGLVSAGEDAERYRGNAIEPRHKRKTTSSSNGSFSRSCSPTSLRSNARRPSTADSDSGRRPSVSGTRPPLHTALESVIPVPPLPSNLLNQHEVSQTAFTSIINTSQEQPKTDPSTHSDAITPAPSGPLPRRPSQSRAHFRKPSQSAANRPLYEIGSIKPLRIGPSRSGSPTKPEGDNSDAPGNDVSRSDKRLEDAPPVPGIGSAKLGEMDKSRSVIAASNPSLRMPFNMPPLPLCQGVGDSHGEGSTTHTPTESVSSNGSTRHSASSRSSPPLSTTSLTGRKFSDTSSGAITPHDTSTNSSPIRNVTTSPKPNRKPAKSFSRPNYAPIVPPPTQQPAEPCVDLSQQPESPMDPAMQNNRLPPLITAGHQFATPNLQSQSAITPSLHSLSVFPSPLLSAPLMQRPPPRRAVTSNRGTCRGCSEAIVGKSVSSADGRLTGRYHKACFVCRTCKEPFATNDFYVLGNQPYCARHYHSLNGTLCAGCDKGIEGQYIEADGGKKFHCHCFSCSECHLILRNDYFESNGKIYCEKHAFHHHPLGPGRRFPERRTTRLMMTI